MKRALLDVNVLVALLDREHQHHSAARRWLSNENPPSWASCPITQNGLVRILSQPGYSNPVSVATARALLRGACANSHHEFWPCDISLLDGAVTTDSLLRSRSITDVYLLALAVAHGGRLITFDRQIPLAAVPSATSENLVVL